MPLVLAPHGAPPDLRSRLASLRRQMRRAASIHGTSAVIALALATFSVVGFLDYHLKLPALIRAIALLGLLVGGAVLIRRHLLRPWRDSRNDLTLALHVESNFPALNDSLASSVAFDDDPDNPSAGSESLRQETHRRASRAAEDCDFHDIVNARGPRRALAAFAAAAAIAVSLMFLYPDAARTAAVRLADPFGAHPWPLQTQLDLTAPNWIARGDPFVLRGELHGVIPDRVSFTIALDGAPGSEQALAVTPEDEGSASVGLRLEPNRVPRSFKYRVRANDADTDWRTVKVVPPPQLVSYDGRPSPLIHLDFPTYTDLAPANLPDGGGHVEGVTGTLVSIRAATDRPVVRAWLEYAADPPRILAGAALFALAGNGALDTTGLTIAGGLIADAVPATLDAGGNRLALAFRPFVSGRYALAFQDQDGIVGRRWLDVRVLTDPPPAVTLERPAAGRDSLAVLADATITLQARIDDPIFAIRSARLEYRAGKDEPMQRLPLFDHQVTGAGVSQLVSPFAPPVRLRPPLVAPARRLPLADLRHANGRPLADGDTLTLQVVADDFDDVTSPKPAGRSHEVELKIVSPSALQAEVQKAESDIQKELRELHALQSEARQRTQEANDQRRAEGRLRPEDQDRLVQAEQMQQQLRQRLGDEREGLRSTVARLQQTLRDNPLPRAPENDRLDTVAGELDRLGREELPQIEPNIAAARKERGEVPPEARKAGPLPKALEHQRETERTLQELLDQLKPWSDARELRAEAGMIRRELDRLNQQRGELMARERMHGERPENLNQADREELERLRDRQADLAERANDLVQKLDRKADEKAQAANDKANEAQKKDAQAAEKERQAAEAGDDPAKAEALLREARSLRQQAAEARDAADELRREAEAIRAARDMARGISQQQRDAGRQDSQDRQPNQAGDQSQQGDRQQQGGDQSKAQSGQQDQGKSGSQSKAGERSQGKSGSQSKAQSGQQGDRQQQGQSGDQSQQGDRQQQGGDQSKAQSGQQDQGKSGSQSKAGERNQGKSGSQKSRSGQRNQGKSGSQSKAGQQDQAKGDDEPGQQQQPGQQQDQANARTEPLSEQMQQARDRIGENKLGDAKKAQDAAADTLKKVQDKLAEQGDRADDAERLAKRLRGLEQELDDLIGEQERLQRRTEDAQRIEDPERRKEELERLSREQQDLQNRTRELAQRLSRQRGEDAAREMRRATRSMAQAQDAMQQDERADQKQDEALDRLDDAQQDLERAREEAEEQLQREQQAKLADAVRGLRERQEALNTESDRVMSVVRQKAGWDRVMQQSLVDLGRNEDGLSREVERLIEKEFKDDRVISHAVRNASDAMADVRAAIDQVKEDGFQFEKLDADRATVQAPQKLALRRLDQLLDALKPETPRQARNQRQQRDRQQGQGGEGGGGGGGGGGDGIPPLAQLKLLRALQAELNEQTEDFAKAHPDVAKLTEDQKTKLDRLRRDQADLANLLEELSQPDEPPDPTAGPTKPSDKAKEDK